MDWRHNVETAEGLVALYVRLGDMPQPFNVMVKAGLPKETRTAAQNRLLHMWFGEIAKQSGDSTLGDVKGECHRRWGVSIRQRDIVFAWVWERTGSHLDYERQCKLLASGALNVSSKMNTAELSEYMTAIWNEYSPHVGLTDPQELKWREAA